jgi:hypothetical protein
LHGTANGFDLLLDILGLGLGYALFDRSWGTLNQILGLFQA